MSHGSYIAFGNRTSTLKTSCFLLEIQVDKGLKVMKADAMAAAVLGNTTNSLYGQHLGKFLRLPNGTSFSSLMGARPDKKKKALSHIGPKLEFEGIHSDSLPLRVLFQATLKNDKPGCDRLLACIKCKGSVLGNSDLLRDMVVKMMEAHHSVGLQKMSSLRHGSNGPPVQPRQGKSRMAGPPAGVTKLALGAMVGAGGSASLNSDIRTDIDSAAIITTRVDDKEEGGLLTARDVDVGVLNTERQASVASSALHSQLGSIQEAAPPGSAGSGRQRLKDEELPSSRLDSPSALARAKSMQRRRSLAEAARRDSFGDAKAGLAGISPHLALPRSGSLARGGSMVRRASQPPPEGSSDEDDFNKRFEIERKRTMESLEPEEAKVMKKGIGLTKDW